MNPFGLGQAIAALFELAADLVTREKRKETAREKQTFLLVYLFLMIAGSGAVIWTIYSLYFQE